LWNINDNWRFGWWRWRWNLYYNGGWGWGWGGSTAHIKIDTKYD
jgi:hypothetical protein